MGTERQHSYMALIGGTDRQHLLALIGGTGTAALIGGTAGH
ncbi:unnamed protein product [Staurois parvus]|uniref:Uncharacterized protein n=1 Tax=Staurois parvus TaxID=386267 RepID=A0ABN9H7Q2_9NEOB|nr:unnamed protein product [Staurois parvus]